VVVIYGGLRRGRGGSGFRLRVTAREGIVAPGLSSKQTRLRELVAGRERCTAPVFVRAGTG